MNSSEFDRLKFDRLLEMPPFSSLIYCPAWGGGFDFFPSWQGFQIENRTATGYVAVDVDTDENEDDRASPEQAIAYQFLKDNEQAVTDAVLQAIFCEYSFIQQEWDLDLDDPVFRVENASDLQRLITPYTIHVNPESKDGYAYVGFEMDCLWDIEHGLGVMMHQAKCVGWDSAEGAWNLKMAQANYQELA